MLDGPEPVRALEEADRGQRAGRLAGDVQRDGAALARVAARSSTATAASSRSTASIR